jgi:hypothetical protein
MNCSSLLLILSAILLLFIFYSYKKGKFGNMNISDIYKTYPGCSYDNREFPEGSLPASNQLGLTDAEKQNIQLANFVQNSSVYKENL